MTYEEAIEAIKCNYPPSNYSMLREALDLSMKVLEKQIPKKPVESEIFPASYDCPCCNYFLHMYHNSYCESCG